MLTGIAHLSFVTGDMEKSLYYYCGVLGFKIIHRLNDETTGEPWLNYLRISPREYIELFYGGKRTLPPMDHRAGGSHICLQVDDIHAMAKRLDECGAPIDVGPQQGKDHNWQCWSHDPDGNRIEFMQISPDSPQAKA